MSKIGPSHIFSSFYECYIVGENLSPEHSSKFCNLQQCVNFEEVDWTVQKNRTHAAKKATNQYRDDARFQYKNRKSVLVIRSEKNILIGTKRIELDKNYFTKTKFFTADQFNMEVDKPQPKNNPRITTLSQIDGKII